MAVSDYCCCKRVKNVVLSNDIPRESGTRLVVYHAGARLDPKKNAEPFFFSLVLLLRALHGLLIVQRTETELGMDFPHRRLRTGTAGRHHLIDFRLS